MRAAGVFLIAILLQSVPVADHGGSARSFRYMRSIDRVSAGSGAPVCAVLDASVFAHAALTLADLRLFGDDGREIPFVLTTSESSLLPPDHAPILNAAGNADHLVFDVQMPPRSYTELDLKLASPEFVSDFVASAVVMGMRGPGDPHPVRLGAATLFDLTGEHLSRSTAIPLQESSLPFLHVELKVHPTRFSGLKPAPGLIESAEVPPSREAQTLYTTVAESAGFQQQQTQQDVFFSLPAQVPVERVSFAVRPGDKTSFSRTVSVIATTDGQPSSAAEHVSGTVSRVHGEFAGGFTVDHESLSIPAILAANLNTPAKVRVEIDQGFDRPEPFAFVRLEMRRRELCFDPPAGGSTLRYGDPTASAPSYEAYARSFHPAAAADVARLGAEQVNPEFKPAMPPAKSLRERHPELVWLGLAFAVGLIGILGFRATASPHPPR